ncbi:IS1 family transposase [Klebsiella pneumoniae]|uniref:IS1 family transposase n=2 Tax=Klebsiella pneumoniae TaxID=573 RepID=UPI003D359806
MKDQITHLPDNADRSVAKQKFKITNWPTYNKALINRGSITFWLDDEAFQAWYESATPSSRGRPQRFTTLKKLRLQSVNSRIQPGSDVIVCAEMDEQWGYVGAKSRQRWLFYAYDRIRRTVVAHVFGERTLATLERLPGLLSAFEVVVWMTDCWPLYESRLKGKLHVISKRYTQRIERHNLNLRQHLARLGRKSLSFSKSVALHDKVIGHYLNIKHYQ